MIHHGLSIERLKVDLAKVNGVLNARTVVLGILIPDKGGLPLCVTLSRPKVKLSSRGRVLIHEALA